MPASSVRKADAPAAEEPIDEPAAEEPADEPLPADEPPAAVAGEVDDGDDFLAGIEDELGLRTTAEKTEEPPVESAQGARFSSTMARVESVLRRRSERHTVLCERWR